jgi:cytochrome c oxidase subunit 3
MPVLADQFDTVEQQRDAETLGMWVFLATEVLIFGALFTGYSAYRSLHREAFEHASSKLNVLIGGINTIVLLSSSLTMALSVYAARVDRQRMLVGCLIATILLGTTFMAFKALEYYTDYQDKLVPGLAFDESEWRIYSDGQLERDDAPEAQLFLLFYYIMTGLHAVHLAIGIGVLVVLTILARRGRFSSEHYTPVEVAGLYWHFVDVIWIFLLPLLYLIGTHKPSDLHF